MGNRPWVKQTVFTPLAAHPQSVEDATKYPPLPLRHTQARPDAVSHVPPARVTPNGMQAVPEEEVSLTEVGCPLPHLSLNPFVVGCLLQRMLVPKKQVPKHQRSQAPNATQPGPRLHDLVMLIPRL